MPDKPEQEPDPLTNGPPDAGWTLILAHGACQAMDSPFMEHIAAALGAEGLRVVRFEFPYMAEMRRTGKRKPPNRETVLVESWNRAIDLEVSAGADRRRLLIGGKSMGGRMASLIAETESPQGWFVWVIPSTRRASRIVCAPST